VTVRGYATALALALIAPPAVAQPDDGAMLYKRCAACHLANGQGVPGAFPPLQKDVKAFADKPEGRRYLVLVVTRGVSGQIKAEGKLYRGFMPAQAGLADGQIAAILNHVTTPAKPFTADEVSQYKASGVSLRPEQVGELNRKLVGP
jgi:mono/diheme cytochrome c family protein